MKIPTYADEDLEKFANGLKVGDAVTVFAGWSERDTVAFVGKVVRRTAKTAAVSYFSTNAGREVYPEFPLNPTKLGNWSLQARSGSPLVIRPYGDREKDFIAEQEKQQAEKEAAKEAEREAARILDVARVNLIFPEFKKAMTAALQSPEPWQYNRIATFLGYVWDFLPPENQEAIAAIQNEINPRGK